MGRPLRKDVFGTDAIGTFASTASGIKVRFHDGSSLRTDGVIIKQRGAKTFTVCRVGDIGTTSAYINAVLKNGTPSAAGEMQLIGYTAGGADASATNVAKITKRIITDFSGARYTWFLDNDSSGDQIIITAL
jgi:hypothetical protein